VYFIDYSKKKEKSSHLSLTAKGGLDFQRACLTGALCSTPWIQTCFLGGGI
jgi:hypothetical protein